MAVLVVSIVPAPGKNQNPCFRGYLHSVASKASANSCDESHGNMQHILVAKGSDTENATILEAMYGPSLLSTSVIEDRTSLPPDDDISVLFFNLQ